jgi:hypothetical protein
MQEFLDSDLAQAGGYTTIGGYISLTVMEWITHMTFDNVLQSAMGIGGLIFLGYKIANARLDRRIKKKQLKDED